jgi:hypothetical protein
MIPEVSKDEYGNPKTRYKYDVDRLNDKYLP